MKTFVAAEYFNLHALPFAILPIPAMSKMTYCKNVFILRDSVGFKEHNSFEFLANEWMTYVFSFCLLCALLLFVIVIFFGL